MTEARIRDLLIALESARDADARGAGDLMEFAGLADGVRDSMAELMVSSQAKALGFDKPLAALRISLAELIQRAQAMGLARAAACEALTRRIGPPRSSLADDGSNDDTVPMSLDEIAAINAEDKD